MKRGVICENSLIVLVAAALSTSVVWSAERTADEVAAELANPANSFASMSLSLQYTTFEGDLPDAGGQDGTALIFQPTFPFPVGDSGKNLIFRPALTGFASQPAFDSTPGPGRFEDENWAFGDIGFDAVLAGTSDSGVIFGWGVAGTLPTGSNAVTGDQWRLGPEIFFGLARKWGVVGH